MKSSQRVSAHTRRVDGKRVGVRAHTRRAQWAYAKSTWAGVGITSIGAAGIAFQMGITLISLALVLVTALLGFLLVLALRSIERHLQELGGQPTRRSRSRPRTNRKPRPKAQTRPPARRTTHTSSRRARQKNAK